jgi:hypothetical protein
LRFIEPIEAEPDEAESTEPTPAQQSVDKEAEAVELTIERPRGDQDDVVDVEQLDLF